MHVGMGAAADVGALRAMWHLGLWGAAARVPGGERVLWLLATGCLMLAVGGLADAMEAIPVRFPRWFALGLAAFTAGGALLLPLSGFWLLVPPAVAALARRYLRSDWAPGRSGSLPLPR